MADSDIERRNQEISELYRVHKRLLVSIVAPFNRGKIEPSEDDVQDSFLNATRFWGSMNGEPRNWLIGIALNKAKDTARRRASRPQTQPFTTLVDGVFLEHESPTSRTEDPAISTESKYLRGRINRALSKIKPLIRKQALELFFMQDLTYEQIAEILDIPLNTAKSHIRRGRASMQRSLIDFR